MRVKFWEVVCGRDPHFLASGAYGIVVTVDDGSTVVKYASEAKREVAILRFLKRQGVSGIVPLTRVLSIIGHQRLRNIARWLGVKGKQNLADICAEKERLHALVMPHAGTALADLAPTLTMRQTLDALCQVFRTLATLGTLGVRHNDLHSSNVLGNLHNDYSITWRIVDWGMGTCDHVLGPADTFAISLNDSRTMRHRGNLKHHHKAAGRMHVALFDHARLLTDWTRYVSDRRDLVALLGLVMDTCAKVPGPRIRATWRIDGQNAPKAVRRTAQRAMRDPRPALTAWGVVTTMRQEMYGV